MSVEGAEVLIAGCGLLIIIISGILGVFYKLIIKNVSSNFQLSNQESRSNIKLFEERLMATSKLFEEKLDATTKSYAARVDGVWREFRKQIDADKAQDNVNFEKMSEALSSTNTKLENLDSDYRDFLAKLPIIYVQRDDWIREFNKVDAKLDAIWSALSKTRETVAKGKKA